MREHRAVPLDSGAAGLASVLHASTHSGKVRSMPPDAPKMLRSVNVERMLHGHTVQRCH